MAATFRSGFTRRQRRAIGGSVMLEFMLSFPIVILTFFFALQVMYVHLYDVLGTYAAFAAARSYSVFRCHPLEVEYGGTPQERQQRAALLARDVAVAIMATYSGKTASGATESELELADGVAQAAKNLENFLPLDWGAYQTARERMCGDDASFAITEYAPSGVSRSIFGNPGENADVPDPGEGDSLILPLRDGYGFRDGHYVNRDGSGWNTGDAISTESADPSFFERVQIWIIELVETVTGKKTKLPGMAVARVSFTYNYPMITLGLGKLAGGTGRHTVPIYNACAMPIEPDLLVDNPEENQPTDINIDSEKLNDQLNEQDKNIKAALAGLKDIGIKSKDALDKLPDRRTWSSDPQWQYAKFEQAKPVAQEKWRKTYLQQEPAIAQLEVTDHGEYIENEIEHRNRVVTAINTEITKIRQLQTQLNALLKAKRSYEQQIENYQAKIRAAREQDPVDMAYVNRLVGFLNKSRTNLKKTNDALRDFYDANPRHESFGEDLAIWEARLTDENTLLTKNKKWRDSFTNQHTAVKITLAKWYQLAKDEKDEILNQVNALPKLGQ